MIEVMTHIGMILLGVTGLLATVAIVYLMTEAIIRLRSS